MAKKKADKGLAKSGLSRNEQQKKKKTATSSNLFTFHFLFTPKLLFCAFFGHDATQRVSLLVVVTVN